MGPGIRQSEAPERHAVAGSLGAHPASELAAAGWIRHLDPIRPGDQLGDRADDRAIGDQAEQSVVSLGEIREPLERPELGWRERLERTAIGVTIRDGPEAATLGPAVDSRSAFSGSIIG